jgi:hypothetical protein
MMIRQGELRQELKALRFDTFCPGDEAPLNLAGNLNTELDDISGALSVNCWWEHWAEG